MKKIVLGLGLSAAMFLFASQALAFAYAPGTFGATTNGQPVNSMMQNTSASGIMGNRAIPVQQGANMMYSYNNTTAWYGLMFVITVALVWVVLLLLILLLLKMLKKHKK